ncbi:hypothetical protein chiPu_0031245, partial [Chiloscyllium punctatum]|nr:hypothetical protein [Chiloscyllium punctatum]
MFRVIVPGGTVSGVTVSLKGVKMFRVIVPG